jgi:alginate O-acetyltransferase complex protein AlgI
MYNFAAAALISRSSSTLSRKFLALAIFQDILALSYFKYCNFFIDSANYVTNLNISHQNVELPLAISFYTFHIISYLVDLQAGRVRRAGIREYLFYLGFFPHLVAGPIVRAWQFFPQIGRRRAAGRDIPLALYQFAIGIFLKSIVADNIADLIDPVWGNTTTYTPTGADHWCTAFLYYCQIYADFAGYSLMALGMSRFLGYRLPQNFRQPMFASNLQDFWRRWHITLSRWLRDYLYKPLGGNRNGAFRTGLNLMITMVLGGLWHGSAWTFVIWGLMHGIGLWVERALGFNRSNGTVRIAWFFVTQLWVTIAWIFFREPDVLQAFDFIRSLASISPGDFFIHPPIQLACCFGLLAILSQAYQIGIVRLPHRFLPATLGFASAAFLCADIVIYAPSKVFIYFKF